MKQMCRLLLLVFLVSATDNFAGIIQSSMSGTVILHVQEGQFVSTGDLLFVVESMKMNVQVAAPYDGYVHKISVQNHSNVSANSSVLELLDRNKFVIDTIFGFEPSSH